MNALKVSLWVAIVLAAWRLWSRGEADSPLELRIAMSVGLCIAGLLVVGRRAWFAGKKAGTGASGRHFSYALAWVLVVVLGSICTALLMRGPTEQVIGIWQQAVPTAGNHQQRKSSPSKDVSGNWLWEEGARRSLPRKTNLKLGRRPEVFLRLDDASLNRGFSERTIYVTAVQFDRYRNSTWEFTPSPTRQLWPDANGIISLHDAPAGGLWHTVVLSASTRRRTPLVGLQGAHQVGDVESLERWSNGLFLLPTLAEKKSGYRYRVCSAPARLGDLQQGTGHQATEADLAANREFPDSPLNQRIAKLAGGVAQSASPTETLRLIESHLRNEYRYSLRTRNPRNLEPIENFLFEEKTGHCEYFATAGALMARARGIPARVVYGWAGGTWYEYANWFVFRADEAHAWVEAWIDGHGWVVMEPTPEQARREQMGADLREELPPLPEAGDDPLEWQHLEEEAPGTTSSFPWAFPLLGIVCASVAWLILRKRSQVTEIGTSSSEPWRETHAAHYLELWKSVCRRHNPQRDLHTSTLRQQLDWWNPKPEFAEDLWRYHYRVRYHNQPASRRLERQLLRRIRAWSVEFRNKP